MITGWVAGWSAEQNGTAEPNGGPAVIVAAELRWWPRTGGDDHRVAPKSRWNTTRTGSRARLRSSPASVLPSRGCAGSGHPSSAFSGDTAHGGVRMSRSIGRRRPAGAARPAAGGAARPGTRPAVRPGRRPVALVVALVASVVAFAAGCTSAVPGHATAGPPPPTTARGAMYLAMLNLAAASAVRYRGSFDNGGDTTGLDATVTSAGEASGTLTVDGVQLGMLVLQGATYLRAPESFWAGDSPKNGITRRYGGNWVRVPPKVFGLDVGAVLAPAALARSQHPVIAGVPEGHVGDLDASSVNGVRSVKVEAQGTVYELSADQPYRLLRLSTPAVPKFTAPRRFATGSSTIAERGGTLGPAPRAAVPPKPGTPVPAAPDAKDLRVDLTDASADLARVYAELASRAGQLSGAIDGDRKSTRLNSSHVKTSYAVFCLKK